MNGKLQSIWLYDEGQKIELLLSYQKNVELVDDKDQNGKKRSSIKFSGYVQNGKAIANSFGVLTYTDHQGLKITDEGYFTEEWLLTGIGKR